MNERYKYMVQVRCMTFNQANFIEDAMNGFTMQETTFPYVCIIIDDASTDGEQEVIKKYLEQYFDFENSSIVRNEETDDYILTFAQHKTNRNCFFAVLFLKYNHYSIKKSKGSYLQDWTDTKYIAYCEGDDYWTDSTKLQKQVDFLETHLDYSLCCHRFKIYHEKRNIWTDDYVKNAFAANPNVTGLEVTNSENFKTRFTWTLTLCCRKAVVDEIEWPPYKYGQRDFNFHYHLLKAGKGWCFADYMGVYRMTNGGIWARKSRIDMDRFRLNGYEDFYSFHKDDEVILERYLEWLDKFFNDYVISPLSRHRITRNGVKCLFIAERHYWKLKGPSVAINKIFQCVKAFFGLSTS